MDKSEASRMIARMMLSNSRRNIPDYARVELNLRKEDILKPIAKENLSLGGKGLPILAKVELNLRKEDILKPIAKTTQGHRSDLSSTLTESNDQE